MVHLISITDISMVFQDGLLIGKSSNFCVHISVYSKLSVSHTFLEQVSWHFNMWLYMSYWLTYWKIHACIDCPLLMLVKTLNVWQCKFWLWLCRTGEWQLIQPHCHSGQVITLWATCLKWLPQQLTLDMRIELMDCKTGMDMQICIWVLLSLFVLGYAFESYCQFNSSECWF